MKRRLEQKYWRQEDAPKYQVGQQIVFDSHMYGILDGIIISINERTADWRSYKIRSLEPIQYNIRHISNEWNKNEWELVPLNKHLELDLSELKAGYSID